ncbi:hypothetical protein ISF_05597 [Cordyceps fumosorosea ARSEF 2679]|uniref:Uncharacterized protein n=1 Tax=Cordyceps fumosorosea (strain ARSEF 2679) TaxID=1081104 RepID=A0A167UEV8_CORFA|nr:hypothetical protein ISF_05597 [Cordyceps fumosorosea ARSEF 2679]OAA61518.1 hypothetical protein ISF_05597 [Cordyceps fumosorosea ARSEF 2679]
MSGYAAEMHVRDNVRMLCSRVQTLLHRRPKQQPEEEQGRVLPFAISAPFDFRLGQVSLPGISHDEITMLREKATASRVGIAEYIPRSSSSMTSWDAPPRPRSSPRGGTFPYSRAHTPPHAHARRPVW